MNTNFETKGKGNKAGTVEWYTPPEIIRALGRFDLDPCTSAQAIAINHSAKNYFTRKDNGLKQAWSGRVWLNPPYDPSIHLFMEKMSEHGNGIALIYTRCDSAWFQRHVLGQADAVLFLKKRIRFLNKDGQTAGSPGCGSLLAAYGKRNAAYLRQCTLEGKYVGLNH